MGIDRTLLAAAVIMFCVSCRPADKRPDRCSEWMDGPPLTVARVDHTMTALDDGRVFVAGGRTPEGISPSTEIWGPGEDSWTAGPELEHPRAGHAAVRLEDGRVLLAGGEGPDGALDTAELFDPENNTFTTTTMSGPHTEARAARVPDGRVLLMSGIPSSNTPSTEFFDPAKQSWRSPGGPHEPLEFPSINPIGTEFAVVVGHTDQTPHALEFWYNASGPGELGEQFEGLRAPECVARDHTSLNVGDDTWMLLGGTLTSGPGCVVTIAGGGPSIQVVHDRLDEVENVIAIPGLQAFAGSPGKGTIVHRDGTVEDFPTFELVEVESLIRADDVVMTSGGMDESGEIVATTKLLCN